MRDKYFVNNKIFVNHKTLTLLGLVSTVGLLATVGANIKRLRERHKPRITQRMLAERLGHANSSNISTWENGEILPDPDTVRRLAAALECETRELFEDVTLPYDELRGIDLPRHGSAVQGTSPKLGESNDTAARIRDLEERNAAYKAMLGKVRRLADEAVAVLGSESDAATRVAARRGRRNRGTSR